MGPWGFVVLAAFVVTLLGGLTLRFGIHTFVAASLANLWFLAALSLSLSYDASDVSTTACSQALAWLIGSALSIAVLLIGWLARHRRAVSSHFPEIPSDTSPMKLTRPLILYAVIRPWPWLFLLLSRSGWTSRTRTGCPSPRSSR